MPGLKIAFVHPGVTINRTAGSGTKGQTIGTLFNQQVIEIAFACGTAPVAVTDAAPTGIVHKITPLQVKIATFCRRGHGSTPIFHGFAQRCIGQDIERIEIDAVETDIAGNSQIFSPGLRILTRQTKQQVTDHRGTVAFDQAFHKRNSGWSIRGAGHFLADFAVKRLNTN